jgi:predicted AAA+ superfamily ATPase
VEYVPRIADSELDKRLRASGAVVIEGPKACGKTATARQRSASEVLLDVDARAQQAAAIDPALLLDGEVPRLFDEWQRAPALWDHVRRAVDDRGSPGQFILTGSATPADDETRHTGAMRFGMLRMRPMTLVEAGRSTGAVSLAALLDGAATRSTDPGLSLADVADELARGGWPGLRSLSVDDATRAVRDYIDRIRRADIRTVDGVRRDPNRVGAVLRSLARHTATQASTSKVARDAAGADAAIKDETVGSYVDALRRLMIVEDQPAWNVHVRSSHSLRTTPTRHLADPSLAVAALRATPPMLMSDLNALGYLFESLVIRDLRVYAQPLDGEVFHYRDQSQLEVDAIVDCGERWAGFEVKLGGDALIDEAARNLLAFAKRVDTSRRGTPLLLGVIVATGFGYVRPDGVHVIPIGALGP